MGCPRTSSLSSQVLRHGLCLRQMDWEIDNLYAPTAVSASPLGRFLYPNIAVLALHSGVIMAAKMTGSRARPLWRMRGSGDEKPGNPEPPSESGNHNTEAAVLALRRLLPEARIRLHHDSG